MAEFSPLAHSLEEVADLLFYAAHPGQVSHGKVTERADELRLVTPLRAMLHEKLQQVSVPPSMKTFLDWMQCVVSDSEHDYHQNDANPLELFLQEEFEKFLSRSDARAQECSAIFAELRNRGASSEIISRIQEICFQGGVILRFRLEIAKYLTEVHKIFRKEQKRLVSLKNRIAAEPLPIDAMGTREQTLEPFNLMIKLLQTAHPTPDQIKSWNKSLDIDNALEIAPQKHKLWTSIFVELVSLLKPFCPSSKDWIGERPDLISEETFAMASLLMNLTNPDLWPHAPKRVKNRYLAHLS
ncbi:MAG: hypothetical protein O7G88_20860 [bacterium]|nr:hypothetical protein [bacterium]